MRVEPDNPILVRWSQSLLVQESLWGEFECPHCSTAGAIVNVVRTSRGWSFCVHGTAWVGPYPTREAAVRAAEEAVAAHLAERALAT